MFYRKSGLVFACAVFSLGFAQEGVAGFGGGGIFGGGLAHTGVTVFFTADSDPTLTDITPGSGGTPFTITSQGTCTLKDTITGVDIPPINQACELSLTFTNLPAPVCEAVDTDEIRRTFSFTCEDAVAPGSADYTGFLRITHTPLPFWCQDLDQKQPGFPNNPTVSPCQLNIGAFPASGNGAIQLNKCADVFTVIKTDPSDPTSDPTHQIFRYIEQLVPDSPAAVGPISCATPATVVSGVHEEDVCTSDNWVATDDPACKTHKGLLAKGDGTGAIILGVTVDIRPNDPDNFLNRADTGKLPVAILGDASFDVTRIDTTTVLLDGEGVGVAPDSFAIVDADLDGLVDDIVFQFPIPAQPAPDLGVVELNAVSSATYGAGPITLHLEGNLLPAFDSTQFVGSDQVTLIQTVSMDIKPANCNNVENMAGNGNTPIAIVGGDPDGIGFTVDATQIKSVQVEGITPSNTSIAMVSGGSSLANCDSNDGIDDLLLQIDTPSLASALSPATSGAVRAKGDFCTVSDTAPPCDGTGFTDRAPFEATDVINP